ncbi:hypothetical protein GG344DRAFT_81642 [Lentinula edodes]|nr:hypothetical protein GG344DRAFT_81642 [Lentinula edodes]
MAHDGELGTERTFFVVDLTQVTSLFGYLVYRRLVITTMFNGPRGPICFALFLSAGFDRASHAEIPQDFNIGGIENPYKAFVQDRRRGRGFDILDEP